MKQPKPGRELDAIIAEKVMGWTHKPLSYFEPISWNDRRALDPAKDTILCDTHHFAPELPIVPSYSTDIKDAWLVVEKLKKDQCAVDLSYGSDKVNQWTAVCKGYAAWSPTAPHAICLAALAAMENK